MFGYYWWQADDIIIASLLGHCWQADDIIIGGCFQNINNALQITIPFFFFNTKFDDCLSVSTFLSFISSEKKEKEKRKPFPSFRS